MCEGRRGVHGEVGGMGVGCEGQKAGWGGGGGLW